MKWSYFFKAYFLPILSNGSSGLTSFVMEFTDEELEADAGEVPVPVIEAPAAEVGLSLLKSLRSVIFNVEDFF